MTQQLHGRAQQPTKARAALLGPKFGPVQALWAALLLAPVVVVASAAPAQQTPGAAAGTATRCGWWDNPTPGNATLTDRDGEWLVGRQGGHQASGNWPEFSRGRWVQTGSGSAGYGCTCIKVVAEAETQEIRNIVSARTLPLTTCRNDKALRGKEPQNPLK